VIFLAGGTGALGRRIADRLAAREEPLRALVRPQTDASELDALGAEVVRGDFRDPESLRRGVAGARVVITTVNSISRAVMGENTATIADVDVRGNANLADAAADAGVERFVFLSFVLSPRLAGVPFAEAKRATEERLARSPGHCMTMGTASTMTSVAEVLGMTLPGAASIPAVDSAHTRRAAARGRP
jgi:uncharacterized protein YbjT (DUF2867 family)